jgi:colanic acid biosynthesis glycosyl transferase WcaI
LPAALARGLFERGHEVDVVTGFPNYPTGAVADGYAIRPRLVERTDGVRVTRVALYPSHDARPGRRLANYGSFAASAALLGVTSAFRGLDALWVNYSPVTVALPMFMQTLTRGTPCVVHALDLWPDTLTASGFSSANAPGGRMLTRALHGVSDAMYRAAEKVAYISPGVGEILMERGVPQSKLAYAPMWANESLFKPCEASNDHRYGLGADEVALVYAGTLGRAQDLETLIRACAQLDDLPFTCLIAGAGTEEARLRGLADSLEASRVRFLGRLPESEMPALLAASDINYVALNGHPLARITMPSKLQGIMAAGRPVLGSLLGDAASVVTDADAGWVIHPGDVAALAGQLRGAVLSGRARLADLGRSARAYYVREFSYEQGVGRIESLLVGAAGASR